MNYKYTFISIKIILIFIIGSSFLTSKTQESDPLNKHYKHEFQTFKEFIIKSDSFKGDTNIDVKFYYLDISIGVEDPFVGGRVQCVFESLIDNLSTVELNLNRSLTVDNISEPCESFYQGDDKIYITLDDVYNIGDLLTIDIYYQGVPVLAGGYKGLRYEDHGNNEPIIATLSTPFLAHYWYPCKDGPEDKADSVYLDITIPDISYNGFDLMATSNGILENVIDNGDTKTFQWRHRYPIVTYYVMAAVSNYDHFQQTFNGTGGETFPLDYYVFHEDLNMSEQGVVEMPEIMQFFIDLFGTYPFNNEKYAMTQLGYYGAIENQTNTIINNMSTSWIYISAHELAHMWFGDNITCSNWHHAWLNEGFASYSEALWQEHKYNFDAYKDYIEDDEYWDGGTLYLQNAADTFNIFQNIIYKKGSYVLHMLRGVLGDDLFFEALKDYAEYPDLMFGNATTEDLKDIFEASSGKELDAFIDQWIYDEYYPIYYYNYQQNEDHSLYFMIYQAQEELYNFRAVFEMPIHIKLDYTGGGDTTIILNNIQQTQYFVIDLEEEIDNVSFDPDKWILRQAEYHSELPVGIFDINEREQIKVYPNPVIDELIVSIPQGINKKYQLMLFDAVGKFMGSYSIVGGGLSSISLYELNEGIYFYHITDNQNIIQKRGKFVKN